jgi:hypothetical protein
MVSIGKRDCDICGEPAKYDAKTRGGPWAYLCQEHYDRHALKIKGLSTQLTVDAPEPKG